MITSSSSAVPRDRLKFVNGACAKLQRPGGALACRGGVRRDVGKEAMGHAVIPGMLKNLLFVFLKIIHTYSLRRQVFEYILLHYTK